MMSNIQASVQQLTQQAFNTALVGPYNVKQFNERKRMKKAEKVDTALSKSAGKFTSENLANYNQAGEIYQKLFDQDLLEPKDYPKMAEIARNAAAYRQQEKKINKAYSKLDAKKRLATLKEMRADPDREAAFRGSVLVPEEPMKRINHKPIMEKINNKQQSTIKSILGGK